MGFNQNHASILHVVSSIIIIVGLPSGFYLMFRMLDVIDNIKYASTEIGEGFMTGLQNGLNETLLNSLRQVMSEERTNNLENSSEMDHHLWRMAKQLTHTVVINAITFDGNPSPVIPRMPTTSCPAFFTMIYQEPQLPFLHRA